MERAGRRRVQEASMMMKLVTGTLVLAAALLSWHGVPASLEAG